MYLAIGNGRTIRLNSKEFVAKDGHTIKRTVLNLVDEKSGKEYQSVVF